MTDPKQPHDPFDLAAGVPAIEGEVRPTPRFADRISRRVLVVLVALALVMLGLFFWALDSMERSKQQRKDVGASAKAVLTKPAETVVPKDLTEVSDADPAKPRAGSSLVATQEDVVGDSRDSSPAGRAASLIRNSKSNAQPAPSAKPDVPELGGVRAPGGGSARPVDEGLGAGDMRAGGATGQTVRVITPEEQAANQAKMERLKRREQARSQGLVATAYAGDDKKGGVAAGGLPAAASALLSGLAAQSGGTQAGNQIAAAAQQRTGDSEQDEKLHFLKTAGKDDSSYLQHSQSLPVSKNEVKRGSYIPLRLEVAINSDQPGMINARVTEDVYDTVTGCRLLIPAMTLVQGAYDSKVALGQTRNLAVWNYMRFEDGSELNLGGMQGYDSSGAAGLAADVDNHYARLFGLAFGMSMITAQVQISVAKNTSTSSTGQTPEQAIATALAQQYGQLGAQIISRHMQVQPTLRNYPGERFIIMTPSTIIFKKVWRKRC